MRRRDCVGNRKTTKNRPDGSRFLRRPEQGYLPRWDKNGETGISLPIPHDEPWGRSPYGGDWPYDQNYVYVYIISVPIGLCWPRLAP